MMRFPYDKSPEEYVAELVTTYSTLYPIFGVEQIKKPITIVISCIKVLFTSNILVPEPLRQYYHMKLLPLILNYSQEEYLKRTNQFAPQTVLDTIYFFKQSVDTVIEFQLEKYGNYVPFPKADKKVTKEYLAYISEMTKRCVTDLAEVMIKNTPYEVKQAYNERQTNPTIKTATIPNTAKAVRKRASSTKSVRWQDKKQFLPRKKRQRSNTAIQQETCDASCLEKR